LRQQLAIGVGLLLTAGCSGLLFFGTAAFLANIILLNTSVYHLALAGSAMGGAMAALGLFQHRADRQMPASTALENDASQELKPATG
jgi:hypothetical protein